MLTLSRTAAMPVGSISGLQHADANVQGDRELRGAVDGLLQYCRRNDWAGYDPYDALNSRLFDRTPLSRIPFFRLVLTQAMKRLPINLRPLLLVPRTRNPKAIGLFLSSLVRLSAIGVAGCDQDIASMIDELAAQRAGGTPYWCWGYSFPWQTRTRLVPRGAPNLVCTVFAANALLDAYESSREQRCLDMAASAADYLLKELYWTDGNGTAGFAYPLPGMREGIHNANLLAAALVCRVASLSGGRRGIEEALSAARYSVSRQQRDGSWSYGEQRTQQWVDNFHTGYNLCALRNIGRYAGTEEFESAIHRGYAFYRDAFFRQDGAPRYFHDRTYPLDIHSVAQSIITLVALKELDGNGLVQARRVLGWAMKEMRGHDGSFYYQVHPFYRNRISYMRWSQAWMLRAMTALLEEEAA